jgi:hypothetical protein
MMSVPNEKAAVGVESHSPQSSTSKTPTVNNVGGSDTVHPEKPVQGMPDDQYPHGMKLVFLAGASIVAVFLIALDQVSTLSTCDTKRNTTDTKAV